MFKKYEYNVNLYRQEDEGRLNEKYYRGGEYPSSSTTSVQKKYHNYSYYDDHENIYGKQGLFKDDRADQRYEPRGRAASASGFKRSSIDNGALMRNEKIDNTEIINRGNKKVYFGGEKYTKESSFGKQQSIKIQRKNDENRRYNGQQGVYKIQNKKQQLKDSRKKKAQLRQQSIQGINEKQIFDKIGRINKLNQQINSRLQKMLDRIDGL